MLKTVSIGFGLGLAFLTICGVAEILAMEEIVPEPNWVDSAVDSDLWRVLAEARRITIEGV